MKRLLLLSLSIAMLSLVSCRKPRYCVCTDGEYTYTESLGVTTKRQAENRCSLMTAAYGGFYTCTAQ